MGAPGPERARVRTLRTLISTGTEMAAYTGDFLFGDTAWGRYLRYP
jgi:hypothetical protein